MRREKFLLIVKMFFLIGKMFFDWKNDFFKLASH